MAEECWAARRLTAGPGRQVLTWQAHALGAALLPVCLQAVACPPRSIIQVQAHPQVGVSACQAAASC